MVHLLPIPLVAGAANGAVHYPRSAEERILARGRLLIDICQQAGSSTIGLMTQQMLRNPHHRRVWRYTMLRCSSHPWKCVARSSAFVWEKSGSVRRVGRLRSLLIAIPR